MYETTYHRASSVDEAAAIFAKSSESKYLAGGHTLIPVMKQRLASPSDVIDLAKIKDLIGIEPTDGGIMIKAATTHYDVANSGAVQKAIPALGHLASLIGDPAVRHRGTIGGSLANNDPAADYPAAVLALDATIKTNKRSISADDFFKGLFATALEDGRSSPPCRSQSRPRRAMPNSRILPRALRWPACSSLRPNRTRSASP
jgi:aerobic carbon-monoxide dehydrogenase medium subunit